MDKKYYWLKLKDDFFKQKELKKLRNVAGGDTYTIIYLKMQLLSLKNDGKLIFDGIEDTFAEELSLELDEKIDDIKMTLAFLKQTRLLEELPQNQYVLPKALDIMGSETATAERMRKYRERKIQTETVTMLQVVTPQLQAVTNCYTEIEIDKRDKEEKREDKKLSGDILQLDEIPFLQPEKKKSINHHNEIIDYFNLKANSKKYQNGSDRETVISYIKSMIKNGDTIEEIKNLIDYKLANPNTQKKELTAWINTKYVGKNMSDAKNWVESGRLIIDEFGAPKILDRIVEAYIDTVSNRLCAYVKDKYEPDEIIAVICPEEYTTPDKINEQLQIWGSKLRYNDLKRYDTNEYTKDKPYSQRIIRREPKQNV